MKQTKKMNNTNVHIVTFTDEEIIEQSKEMAMSDGTVRIGDIILETESSMQVELVIDGDKIIEPEMYTDGPKYGEGFRFNEDRSVKELTIVVAEDLNEKQMMNIFLDLGVEQALVSTSGIKGVKKIEKKEPAKPKPAKASQKAKRNV